MMALVLTSIPIGNAVHAGLSDLFFLLFAMLGYGILGFMDDYIKVVMKRNLGLTARQKLLGQLFIGMFTVRHVLSDVRNHVRD